MVIVPSKSSVVNGAKTDSTIGSAPTHGRSNVIRIESIGITGTHHGGTPAQLNAFGQFLTSIMPKRLHEGDCIGVDAQTCKMARFLGIYVVAHPPDNPRRRAYEPADEVRPEKPYMVRDRDIVDETDILIGLPHEFQEILRSGTWATVRYGVKINHPVYLILPDGKMVRYSGGVI